MSEQAGTSKGRGLRDWVTITQGALLLVAIILIGTLMSGAGRPRAVRAQGPGGPRRRLSGRTSRSVRPRADGQQEQKLVKQFDKNKDDRLDNDERNAARAWLAENGGGGRASAADGAAAAARHGRRQSRTGAEAGRRQVLRQRAALRSRACCGRSSCSSRTTTGNRSSRPSTTRTSRCRPWSRSTAGPTGTSACTSAACRRSSWCPPGSKRSLNLTFDFVDEKQSLLGYRTLNLLNVNGDPTFVRSMLYSDIARAYIPAPKTNYLRVVINGESWGVYINAQQYNKDFVRDYFKTEQGARWKVPGSPGGRGGMEYLG